MTPSPAGFVLAGGRSSRMGRDKALLELDGETLLERGLRQLREVCAEVAIAGGAPELGQFARVIADERGGEGPLAGIIAALAASAAEWNLFCPVDVPFVPRQAWERLVGEASAGGADAVLARVAGQVQPLCGLYRRRLVEPLRAQLESGQRRVTAAVMAAGTVVWVEFAGAGEAQWFRNVNTPEDYAGLMHPTR